MNDEITVRIEGEGLSVTKKTSLHKAGQIISFLGFENDSNISPSNPTASATSLMPAKRLQARDLISDSMAKTYPQKIAAIALYMRDQLGQEQFSPDEVRMTLKKLGDEPRNFARDLRVATELQYVILVDSSANLYELTEKGADAVENNFAGTVVKKSVNPKRQAVSKGISEEVKALENNSVMDGYVGYHETSTKGDKILWLLEYADKNGVNALTPTEIEYLSGQLRDRITSKSFTALNERNMKNGFVSKTSAGFQIQKRGKDQLGAIQAN